MATPLDKVIKSDGFTLRRYKDGQTPDDWRSNTDRIFVADESHKCPTYINKTPPCQQYNGARCLTPSNWGAQLWILSIGFIIQVRCLHSPKKFNKKLVIFVLFIV